MPESCTNAELTSPDFWDTWWSSRHHERLNELDPQFGASGYFLKAIERHIGPLQGRTVAEFGGCISYRLVSMVKYGGACGTAIDYSPAGIEHSRSFYAEHGCDVELICSDFFAPALDGRRFDVVTHWGVLEHQIDPVPLIRRSVELTTGTGVVMFAMPQMRGPGAWLWRRFSPNIFAHHTFHSDEKILDAFAAMGWKCKRVFWGQPFIHMTPCETTGRLQSLAAFGQKWARRLIYLNVPFQYGLPLISENRGFVAWRA